MRSSAGFVAACFLAGMVTAAHGQAACGATPIASLPLYPQTTGKFAVPLSIGGHEFRLEVDTGARFHVLTASVVDALSLERQTLSGPGSKMVGGAPLNVYVTAQDIALGKLKTDSLQMFVLSDERLRGADGLLAADLYKHFDVELDYGAGRVNLLPPCPGRGAYWAHKDAPATVPFTTNSYNNILVPATIGGKAMTVRLDTGASETVLDVGALSVFGLTTNSPGVTVTGGSGLQWFHYTFDALNLGGLTLPHPEVAFIFGGPRSELFVGSDVLRHYHVLISYVDKTMTLTPATDDPALAATLDAFARGRQADVHHDVAGAIAAYSQAISAGNLPPSYLAAVYRARAISQAYAKQCDPAIADLNAALKLDPSVANAHLTAVDSYLGGFAARCPDYPFRAKKS